MSRDAEQAEHVVDLLADWAPVRWRRMFGGIGLFRGALMFGLVFDGQAYFRVERDVAAAAGDDTFQYRRSGRMVRLPYIRVDAEALEQPSLLQALAARALSARATPHKQTTPRGART